MRRTSVCQTCGLPLLYGDGGMGPLGWHDPDAVDDIHDGRTCELTGDEHVPGDVVTV